MAPTIKRCFSPAKFSFFQLLSNSSLLHVEIDKKNRKTKVPGHFDPPLAFLGLIMQQLTFNLKISINTIWGTVIPNTDRKILLDEYIIKYAWIDKFWLLNNNNVKLIWIQNNINIYTALTQIHFKNNRTDIYNWLLSVPVRFSELTKGTTGSHHAFNTHSLTNYIAVPTCCLGWANKDRWQVNEVVVTYCFYLVNCCAKYAPPEYAPTPIENEENNRPKTKNYITPHFKKPFGVFSAVYGIPLCKPV